MPHPPQQSRSDPEPRGVATDGAADATGTAGAVITFDAETVARAIVFHMLDEGLARGVTAESVKRTVARLRRRGVRPEVRRTEWQLMTNHERLEWLLAASLTVPFMRADDDVVRLESRDDR